MNKEVESIYLAQVSYKRTKKRGRKIFISNELRC